MQIKWATNVTFLKVSRNAAFPSKTRIFSEYEFRGIPNPRIPWKRWRVVLRLCSNHQHGWLWPIPDPGGHCCHPEQLWCPGEDGAKGRHQTVQTPEITAAGLFPLPLLGICWVLQMVKVWAAGSRHWKSIDCSLEALGLLPMGEHCCCTSAPCLLPHGREHRGILGVSCAGQELDLILVCPFQPWISHNSQIPLDPPASLHSQRSKSQFWPLSTA